MFTEGTTKVEEKEKGKAMISFVKRSFRRHGAFHLLENVRNCGTVCRQESEKGKQLIKAQINFLKL